VGREQQETDLERHASNTDPEGWPGAWRFLAATCISTSRSQSRSLFLSPSLSPPKSQGLVLANRLLAWPQDSTPQHPRWNRRRWGGTRGGRRRACLVSRQSPSLSGLLFYCGDSAWFRGASCWSRCRLARSGPTIWGSSKGAFLWSPSNTASCNPRFLGLCEKSLRFVPIVWKTSCHLAALCRTFQVNLLHSLLIFWFSQATSGLSCR